MNEVYDLKNYLRCLALLACALLLAAPLPGRTARAETGTVRVLLSVESTDTLSVKVKGGYMLAETGASFSGGTLKLTAVGSTVTATHSKKGELFSGKSVTVVRQDPRASAGSLRLKADGYTRTYLGSLRVTAKNGYLQVVNEVPLSHYLYGVVGYEMNNAWPIEALKAQAVAAKNYAIAHMGGSGSYDVRDTAADQVYKGYVATLKNVIAAVDATMQIALYLNDAVMPCWYSASNGGYTMLPSANWNDTAFDAGYAAGTDPFDLRNTACRTETAYIPADLSRKSFSSAALYTLVTDKLNEAANAPGALPEGYVLDSFDSLMSVFSTDENGVATADGRHSQVILTALANIRPAADAETPAPSQSPDPGDAAETLIVDPALPDADADAAGDAETTQTPEPTATPKPTKTPKPTDTPDGALTLLDLPLAGAQQETVVAVIRFDEMLAAGVFSDEVLRIAYALPAENGFTLFRGRFGHGVGMSQRGAQQMAKEGHTFEQILAFYYPGAEMRAYDYVSPEDGGIPVSVDTPAPIRTDAPLPAASETPAASVDPDDVEPETGGGVVLCDTTLYGGPDAGSGAVETLPAGAKLLLTGLSGEWYQAITQPGGSVGFVHYGDVRAAGNAVLERGRVTGSGVNLRTGPGKSFDSIGKLGLDAEVAILALEGDGWYRVQSASGMTGYLSGSYVRIETSDAPGISTPAPTRAPGATPTPILLPTATPSPSPSPTPEPALRFMAYGRINGTNVHFRTGASASTASLGRYSRGTEFGVYDKIGGWYRVRLLSTGQEGYVYSRYLTLTGSGTGSSGDIGSATLTGSGVNLRKGPSTSYRSLGRLTRGTALTITGGTGSWYKVRVDATGQEGYVFQRYVRLNGAAGQPADTGSAGQATVNAGLLNLRDKPDTKKGKVIATLRRGYTVTVHSVAGSWARVSFSGKTGYCYLKYLKLK